MKVSLNWIKQYVDFELPSVDELVEKIGAQLGEIEEVVELGKKYQGIIVVKVVECRKHENSDHLNVCKIDDGGKAQGVERDEKGLVQVVCGAPNARAGIMVAWLPPGSTVPSSFGKDPFVLETRDLRGIRSNGMLASSQELGISDDHDGILEIDKAAKPGDDFAKLYELNDVVIDIENKMFTHRPDCFGQLGIAREIAGILGHRFTSPDWYLSRPHDIYKKFKVNPTEQPATLLPLIIQNELPELVTRFVAVTLSGVVIKPSPIYVQTYLTRLNVRPINNIVDTTNYMMLLTGQPLHAYDYDKVKALTGGDKVTLTVRYPRVGEKIKLLNGKEIEPRSEAIMIAADQKLIGVGGVMGGANTEVDDTTKNIILECASFDMYSIRRTSMAHGLFTDAVTRNTKGQSCHLDDVITNKTVALLKEVSGAELQAVVDTAYEKGGRYYTSLDVPVEFINRRLGLQLSFQEVAQLLENVEFDVNDPEEVLCLMTPSWRTDIEIPEDIVEEVGRLYGFDKLPLELPKRTLKPAKKDPSLELKASIRDALSHAGANEVLTYSFVHGNLLSKAGQDKSQAFQLSNALSPDLQYYRFSPLPSLLDKVHANVKAGYDTFALFELGKGHTLLHKDDAEGGVPTEMEFLDFVYVANGKAAPAGAPFYQARKYLDVLVAGFGLDLVYSVIDTDPKVPVSRPYDIGRSAYVTVKQTQEFLGMVGEFRGSVIKNLKLPDYSAGFSIGWELLAGGSNPAASSRYQALPRFPKVEQDICLKVPIGMHYQELYDLVWQELGKVQSEHTLPSLSPLDIYQRQDDKGYKQVTFRFAVASYEKTMTDAEVNTMLDAVARKAHEKFGAERV